MWRPGCSGLPRPRGGTRRSPCRGPSGRSWHESGVRSRPPSLTSPRCTRPAAPSPPTRPGTRPTPAGLITTSPAVVQQSRQLDHGPADHAEPTWVRPITATARGGTDNRGTGPIGVGPAADGAAGVDLGMVGAAVVGPAVVGLNGGGHFGT